MGRSLRLQSCRLGILAFALVCFVPLVVAAQDDGRQSRGADPIGERALGFTYGDLTGTGLSYREWLGPMGYQFNVGGYYLSVECGDTTYPFWFYDLGASVFLQLFGDRVFPDWQWLYSQLYLLGSVVHGAGGQVCETDTDPVTDDEINTLTGNAFVPDIGIGGGLGAELLLFSRFSFVTEIGYGLTWSFSDEPFAEQFSITFRPQFMGHIRY